MTERVVSCWFTATLKYDNPPYGSKQEKKKRLRLLPFQNIQANCSFSLLKKMCWAWSWVEEIVL